MGPEGWRVHRDAGGRGPAAGGGEPAGPCVRALPPPCRMAAGGSGCGCSVCPRRPGFGAGVRPTPAGPPDLSSVPRRQGCPPWGASPPAGAGGAGCRLRALVLRSLGCAVVRPEASQLRCAGERGRRAARGQAPGSWESSARSALAGGEARAPAVRRPRGRPAKRDGPSGWRPQQRDVRRSLGGADVSPGRGGMKGDFLGLWRWGTAGSGGGAGGRGCGVWIFQVRSDGKRLPLRLPKSALLTLQPLK